MAGGAGCNGGEKALMEPGVRCPGQSDTEYKTEVSLWAISSAPMLVASDVRNMSKLQRELLLNPEIISLNQDSEASVNNGRVHGSAGGMQLWTKTLSDGATAVAVYNSGSSAQVATVRFSDVGLHGTYKVRDLWARKDLGSFDGSYAAGSVESHGTAVFKLTKS